MPRARTAPKISEAQMLDRLLVGMRGLRGVPYIASMGIMALVLAALNIVDPPATFARVMMVWFGVAVAINLAVTSMRVLRAKTIDAFLRATSQALCFAMISALVLLGLALRYG